jgi:glycosyltransferase involved in cell wall biosynthesis
MIGSDERTKMSEQPIVMLLGRPDSPTDAVEEYCCYLSEALKRRGAKAELLRVDWLESGWTAALRSLQQNAASWRGRWILLQYTALSWSARGFPLRFLRVIREVRKAGGRVGVVFHDVEPYSGLRVIDVMRRRTQLRVMQRALAIADMAVFTVSLNAISWLRDPPVRAEFIPVGANLPVDNADNQKPAPRTHDRLCVAVFGFTEGETGRTECALILNAVRFAASDGSLLRLHAFGRGASERAGDLHEGLKNTSVEVQVDGILPAPQLKRALSACDVALFVRAPISSRRGSAIAAISCGLPVIAFSGPDTAPPITDAGVVLISPENKAELGIALQRVLRDRSYRVSLGERSRVAQRTHFGWDAIADRYITILNCNR